MLENLPGVTPELDTATWVLTLWLMGMLFLTAGGLLLVIRTMLNERSSLAEHELRSEAPPPISVTWAPEGAETVTMTGVGSGTSVTGAEEEPER